MASVITGNYGLEIVRKNTFVYKLAKLCSDGRRKNGISRQELMSQIGRDPAPWIKSYSGFVAVGRGRYKFVGELPS